MFLFSGDTFYNIYEEFKEPMTQTQCMLNTLLNCTYWDWGKGFRRMRMGGAENRC